MNFAELKRYATKFEISTALLQIEKAEGIFESSSKLSKFEQIKAQQQINTCLEIAKLAIEDFKADEATKTRFATMNNAEVANENAQANRPVTEHAPLRELSNSERTASDAVARESEVKQYAHEKEEHVDGRPY